MARLPLAALLLKVGHNRRAALGVTALAALTDVLDGWAARRWPEKSHQAGVWLDPLCDKIFVLSALASMWRVQRPPLVVPLLIATREIIQTPLLAQGIKMARQRPLVLKAAPLGKVATVAQFAAIISVMYWPRRMKTMAAISSGIGAAAALNYVKRFSGEPGLAAHSTLKAS